MGFCGSAGGAYAADIRKMVTDMLDRNWKVQLRQLQYELENEDEKDRNALLE